MCPPRNGLRLVSVLVLVAWVQFALVPAALTTLPESCFATLRLRSSGSQAFAAPGAGLSDGLLQGAVAADHAFGPCHLVTICELLVAQVAGEA